MKNTHRLLMICLTLTAAPLVSVLSVLPGCADDPKDPNAELRRQGQALFKPLPAKSPNMPSGPLGKMVRMSVTRFDLPFDSPAESSALWSRLSSDGLNTSALARLNINGISIAKGTLGKAANLMRLLTDLRGKQRAKTIFTTMQDMPSSMPLGKHEMGCTVFTLRSDMTLSGTDHPPGSSRLMIGCGPAVGPSNRTELTFLPQMKTNKRTHRYAKTPTGYSYQNAPKTTSLYDLIWKAVLSDTEFLVIGPSPAAVSHTSPGNSFFLRNSGGRRIATLLLIYVQNPATPTAAR